MNSIKATWTNGQILPAEPVDWPEGSQLVVAPISPADVRIGLTEDEWHDDPQSIAAWIAAVEQIEPLIWQDGEQEAYERFRAEHRQYNTEAVRRQMEAAPGDGDA